MTRTTKLLTWAFLLEMLAVAIVVTAMRGEAYAAFGDLSERARRGLLVSTFGLFFCPAWLAIGWALARRKLAARRPQLAPDHRRLMEISLVVNTVFAAGVQAWMAAGVITGAPPGREFGLRLMFALIGVLMIVTGNFQAKLAPPTGDRAPEPGAWTRTMLRAGWLAVVGGLIVIVGAAALPIWPMFWTLNVVVAVQLGTAIIRMRALRRART